MDEAPPLTGLQADSSLALQIQSEIKKKLRAEYQHAGAVQTINQILPEYIKVMVCNSRAKSEIVTELEFFLRDGAVKFVDWLWEMLADRNPSRTHSAFGAAAEDEEMGEPEAPAEEEKKEEEEDEEKPKRRRDGPPSARGFRAALAATTKEPEVRRTARDREREERRREREERDERRKRRGDERDARDRRRDRREGGESGDRERRRRRTRRDSDASDTEKPRKHFTRPSDHGDDGTPPVTPPRTSATKFRITDNKNASQVAALPTDVRLDVGVGDTDRELLTAQPDVSTRFTITMDKINVTDIPIAAPEEVPGPLGAFKAPAVVEADASVEKEKPWAGFKWSAAVAGNGPANTQKLMPLKAPAGAGKGQWAGAGSGAGAGAGAWTGGNMAWGAGGKGVKGAKGAGKGVVTQGGKGRGSANLVWRPPGATPPAGAAGATAGAADDAAKEAELQRKMETPLAYHTAPQSSAYSPWGAWGGAGRGAGAPRGNKTWVNPALAAKEASTAPAAPAAT